LRHILRQTGQQDCDEKCGLKERGLVGNNWVVLDRDEDHGGQVTKGVWGMSWRQKAMKGVEGCEKPGEAVKQALIPTRKEA
jgi:hypothetical protein